MSEVTRILSAIEQGVPGAPGPEALLPLVYDELRRLAAQKMAQEAPGQTLQATSLVHEAYIRLIGGEKLQHWDSRGHFVAAAAEAMRRILIDRALLSCLFIIVRSVGSQSNIFAARSKLVVGPRFLRSRVPKPDAAIV